LNKISTSAGKRLRYLVFLITVLSSMVLAACGDNTATTTVPSTTTAATSASATTSAATTGISTTTSATTISTSTTSAATTASAGETATYTDMVGRQVTLKKDIKRVAILRTMDFYAIAAILGNELDTKLVAVGESFKNSDIDGYKKFSEVYKNLDKMTLVGSIYDDAISLETMITLNLDLIIVDKQFYGYACVKKMIEARLPVVVTDDNTDPFHGVQQSMLMLGKMLGKEAFVTKMVEYSNQRTDDVLARIDKIAASGVKAPKLYFECGNVTPTEIGGTRGDTSSGWGFLWKKLGADNIGVGNGSNPLNPEKVLSSDPDVIVIGGANWDPTANIMRLGFYATDESASDHLKQYTQRAGWSDLPAIKNKRLYAVHFNIFVRPYSFAGAEAMAKMLYPDKFADLDPEKDLKDFFQQFMPLPYSGVTSATWSGK
jgi:iron complex transport system substrate-binding protein